MDKKLGEEDAMRKVKKDKEHIKKEMAEGMEMDEADKKEEATARKRKNYEEEDIGDEARAKDKEDDGSRPVRTRGEKR